MACSRADDLPDDRPRPRVAETVRRRGCEVDRCKAACSPSWPGPGLNRGAGPGWSLLNSSPGIVELNPGLVFADADCDGYGARTQRATNESKILFANHGSIRSHSHTRDRNLSRGIDIPSELTGDHLERQLEVRESADPTPEHRHARSRRRLLYLHRPEGSSGRTARRPPWSRSRAPDTARPATPRAGRARL